MTQVTDKEYEVGRTGKGREGVGQEGVRCGESRNRKTEEEKEETAVGVSVEATPKSRLLSERTGVGGMSNKDSNQTRAHWNPEGRKSGWGQTGRVYFPSYPCHSFSGFFSLS